MRTNIYSKKIIKALASHHLKTIGEINNLIPEADYSTIFRNIKVLLKSGEVRSVTLHDGKVLYELVDAHTHDHFVCTDCDEVTAVKHVARRLDDVIPQGNKLADIIMRGTCSKCV